MTEKYGDWLTIHHCDYRGNYLNHRDNAYYSWTEDQVDGDGFWFLPFVTRDGRDAHAIYFEYDNVWYVDIDESTN